MLRAYLTPIVAQASQGAPPLSDLPFFWVVWRSLTLEREVFLQVQSETWGLLAVVFVVFFAGFSESLGTERRLVRQPRQAEALRGVVGALR